MPRFELDRRSLLMGALALAACDGAAQPTVAVDRGPAPALKAIAPFPVGTCVYIEALSQPDYIVHLTRHFDQIVAEWQMKMEVIVKENGQLDFSEPDLIAEFARDHGLRLHGHTLTWFSQRPAAFERLLSDRPAFARAYDGYIRAVVGRYRGQAVSWDVVNEPIEENGEGIRGGIWSEAFGPAFIDRAFAVAHEADPQAVLFLNEYDLESRPEKRRTFLRLVETLLKRGVPVGGLGTQCHMSLETPASEIVASMRDLGAFGLPIHVSELYVWMQRDDLDAQARQVSVLAEAFAALPERQRFAFTVWGLRDKDSWRKSEDPRQRPLLLDDNGRPKPAFWAAVDAWS